MDMQELDWRKASYSNGSGNCVEVGTVGPVVLVRDTAQRDGETLSFNSEAWSAFVAVLK